MYIAIHRGLSEKSDISVEWESSKIGYARVRRRQNCTTREGKASTISR